MVISLILALTPGSPLFCMKKGKENPKSVKLIKRRKSFVEKYEEKHEKQNYQINQLDKDIDNNKYDITEMKREILTNRIHTYLNSFAIAAFMAYYFFGDYLGSFFGSK